MLIKINNMGKEKNNYFQSLPNNLTYKPVRVVKIGNKLIGKKQPVFIIAEVGANHRGNLKNALKLIELAAKAGADAIKFQHLTHNKIAADTIVYEDWGKKPVGKLSEFYRSAEIPTFWTNKLIKKAKQQRIIFLSSPFDKDAVDILDKAGVPAFKIASYELTDDVLLRYIAQKRKPIILSTGMAYLEEVAHAVRIIQEEGNNKIILLHCISIYPPKSFKDLNLQAIRTLSEAFKLPVGYSDHSQPTSIAAPIAAVTLGACVIEKHFTTNRKGGSNDDLNSVEIDQFKYMVSEIRNTEQAISKTGIKQPVCNKDHKLGSDEIADRWTRRSLYAAKNIPAGTTITENMIITLRPWGGIAPKDMKIILGKKVKRPITSHSPVTWEDLLDK